MTSAFAAMADSDGKPRLPENEREDGWPRLPGSFRKHLSNSPTVSYDRGGTWDTEGLRLECRRAGSKVHDTTPPNVDDCSVEAPPVIIETRGCPGPPPLEEYREREVARQLSGLSDPKDPLRTRREVDFLVFTALPGGLASAVIHLLLLISLGICMLATSRFGAKTISIEVVEGEDTELLEDEILDEMALDIEPLPAEDVAEPEEATWDSEVFDQKEDLVSVDMEDFLKTVDQQGLDRGAFAAGTGVGDGYANHERPGGGLASRAARRRQALAYGASAESENAVDLALEWLAKHQRQDGSWCFNHREGDHSCEACRCGNPGSYPQALNGATALVLLAYLGAGYTHLEGKYKEEVAAGLRFLIEAQQPDGSLMDISGRMYSHGLATFALCEALAMTRYDYNKPDPLPPLPATTEIDPDQLARAAEGKPIVDSEDPFSDAAAAEDADEAILAEDPPPIQLDELTHAAQSGITFIEKAQHLRGGWRYTPGQAGDTSVVGWQMMALKSAYLAGLDVNPRTVKKAIGFLNYVADDRVGSCYGYTSGNRKRNVDLRRPINATTPIGLLCRMYTGWGHSERGLAVGVARLEKCAQRGKGMYFYYYATQVMHHYEGPAWEIWNAWMRDYLVKTQNRKGSETGSWFFTGPHDDAGRLYCTAMATMTLEVYYRYSPIYGSEAVAKAPGFE